MHIIMGLPGESKNIVQETLDLVDDTNPDSVLLLWVCDPMLDQAFKVIKDWGFNYKTVGFTWAKTNKNTGIIIAVIIIIIAVALYLTQKKPTIKVVEKQDVKIGIILGFISILISFFLKNLKSSIDKELISKFKPCHPFFLYNKYVLFPSKG